MDSVRLTEAEWQIMNALWVGHPATAREIRQRLPAGVQWAHTTIKTMLSRLVDKGAVRESKANNASVYVPALSKRRARRTALKTLVNQAFDGAFGPLMHFLVEDQSLSERQRRELIAGLAKEDERQED